METTKQSTMKYTNPPIYEILCGIRFDPINALQSGHLGVLWQKYSSDFPKIEDHYLVDILPEENPESPGTLPLPRIWFINESENELIQVQRNCFLHNWRKIQPDDEYPGYKIVFDNFNVYLSHFQDFLKSQDLGYIVPKVYELSYIDLILSGQEWENLGDLAKVFPNLLKSKLLNNMSSINWYTTFHLPDDLGQLSIWIRNSQLTLENQHIQIEFRALSSQPYQPMQDWFEIAHNAIVELFSNLISDDIQEKKWGRKWQ